MKSFDKIPIPANILSVVCSRSNAEVGKLVKAITTYALEGKRTELDDPRLDAYFELAALDIDSMRTAAEVKSRKCSESAKCRTTGSSNNSAKKANATNAKPKVNVATVAEVNEVPSSSIAEVATPVVHTAEATTAQNADNANAFNATDINSSFKLMVGVYQKIGNNESQAFDAWSHLTADERMAAFAYAQRMPGDLTSRSYLFIYLRDKEWTKVMTANQ